MTKNQESPWRIISTCRGRTSTKESRTGAARVSAVVAVAGPAHVTRQRTLAHGGVDALTRSSSPMCSQRDEGSP